MHCSRCRAPSANLKMEEHTMKKLLLIVCLMLSFTTVNAQYRDRRYDNRGYSSEKCSRFVNCHDARDGRWDGRWERRRWNRRDCRTRLVYYRGQFITVKRCYR